MKTQAATKRWSNSGKESSSNEKCFIAICVILDLKGQESVFILCCYYKQMDRPLAARQTYSENMLHMPEDLESRSNIWYIRFTKPNVNGNYNEYNHKGIPLNYFPEYRARSQR
uniref:Uncharacterized protein n=1 Tax=Glossina pallidipes TaxID=7398 RepID=A0A1A9ZTW7_GLOPL